MVNRKFIALSEHQLHQNVAEKMGISPPKPFPKPEVQNQIGAGLPAP